jgi:hypothetical protein
VNAQIRHRIGDALADEVGGDTAEEKRDQSVEKCLKEKLIELRADTIGRSLEVSGVGGNSDDPVPRLEVGIINNAAVRSRRIGRGVLAKIGVTCASKRGAVFVSRRPEIVTTGTRAGVRYWCA